MIDRNPRWYITEPGYDGTDYSTPIDPAVSTPEPAPVVVPPPAAAPAPDPTLPVAQPAPQPPRPVPQRAPTSLPVPVIDTEPRYSAADYAGAARALLPRGRAWAAEPGSTQAQVLAAIGAFFARIDAAFSAVLNGSQPGSPTAMLPEWEATLGLPNPFLGANPSIEQRLDQVRGRFVNTGGQSRQRFIDYAAALGFTISITTYAPFRAGLSSVGNSVGGPEWSFVWGIKVEATNGALPIEALLDELEAVKPAESSIFLIK